MPLINVRREYFPREDIIAELEQALASHPPGEIDWVTFVGSGETTLHSSIGWLIRQAKSLNSSTCRSNYQRISIIHAGIAP